MKRRLVLATLALAACSGTPRVPDKMLQVDSTKLDADGSAKLSAAHQELDSVQSANAPGAAELRTSDFTARVADTQRAVEDAESKARELDQDAAKRKVRWEELAREAPVAGK